MSPMTAESLRALRATKLAVAGCLFLALMRPAASEAQRRPPLQPDADCVKCHPPGGRKFTSQFTKDFHATHQDFACRECHAVEPHGALRLDGQKDCTTCHHDPQYHARCPECHPAAELPESLPHEQSVQMSVWEAPRERVWPFQHAAHVGRLECADCHTNAPTYDVTVDCDSCHDQHHSPQAKCQVCHGDDVMASHQLPAHVDCTTSGCHSFGGDSPVSAHRSSCVVCHVEQEDHQPGRNCVTCHVPSGHRFPIRTGR